MSAGDGVTADELIQALARRGATLPAEIGTFIVLEGCETMLSAGPRELAGLGHVRISAQGQISLSGAACDDEPGARSLHRAFKRLLVAAGPRLPPALSRLSDEGPRAGYSLRALRDELEAALVPLNRHASRRVLARFVRETIHPPIPPEEVDTALDSLLGVADLPANDAPGKASHIRSRGPAVPLQVDFFEGLDLDLDHATPKPVEVRAEPPKRTSSQRPSLAPRPSGRERGAGLGPRMDELVELSEPPPPSSRKFFIGLTLIALAIAGVALALAIRARREPPPAVETAALDAPEPPSAGDLVVRVTQPNAQVLRYLGRAPVLVEHLPVGVAHEFVATAEGYRPARVLVPAETDWEATPEGARYEVALQLVEARAGARERGDVEARIPNASEAPVGPSGKSPELELGPSRLASQPSAASTRLGTIRVVATPHGARVYQLVGFSPEVRVQDVPLASPQELLIYREGFAPVLRAISPRDFKPAGTRLVAAVQVELSKR